MLIHMLNTYILICAWPTPHELPALSFSTADCCSCGQYPEQPPRGASVVTSWNPIVHSLAEMHPSIDGCMMLDDIIITSIVAALREVTGTRPRRPQGLEMVGKRKGKGKKKGKDDGWPRWRGLSHVSFAFKSIIVHAGITITTSARLQSTSSHGMS